MEQKPTVPAEETAALSSSSAVADEAKPSSLFPLFSLSNSSSLQTTTSVPQWLCNSSFTTDVSLINDAVASQIHHETTEYPPENDDEEDNEKQPFRSSYEILKSSESDGERREGGKKEKKRKKKKRKHERGELDGYGSRKSRVRAWADSEINTSKDYYIDSHGDPDNLAFGSMYR